jgi:hypothetical protein
MTYPRPYTANQTQGVASDKVVDIVARSLATMYGRTPAEASRGRCPKRAAGGLAVGIEERGPRGALGSTRRPELSQLLAQLLSRRRPVAADVITQLLNVTLEIELILLQPADVELLS